MNRSRKTVQSLLQTKGDCSLERLVKLQISLYIYGFKKGVCTNSWNKNLLIAAKHKIPNLYNRSQKAGKVDGFWVSYSIHFRAAEVDSLTTRIQAV